MHMADALLSPAVGGTMWLASGSLLGLCAKRLGAAADERKVPLMGALGAFVFAAQMINFAIPGTGSSGHLGGGLLVAVLLGPEAAFLTIASVLVVQALFFCDGGLFALGCNIFNMAFIPCFAAYPLIYTPLVGDSRNTTRLVVAALLAGVFALQAGAFCVVLETTLSARCAVPFATFVLLMQPIHLAIGVVEGVASAFVLLFILKVRPALLSAEQASPAPMGGRQKGVVLAFGMAALILGGVVSWFASSKADGLEWALTNASAQVRAESLTDLPQALAASLQQATTLLPEYGFAKESEARDVASAALKPSAAWPAVDAGTSLAGLVGSLLTLGLACLAGWAMKRKGLRKNE